MIYKKRGVVLVVLALLVVSCFIPLTSSDEGDVEGCYYFVPNNGIDEDIYCQEMLYSTALEECSQQSQCSVDQYFTPGDCSEIEECEQITCDVDCLTHSRGYCENLGGSEVSDDDYDDLCSPGCCRIDKVTPLPFCEFGFNKYECKQKAIQALGYYNPADILFENSVGMTANKCKLDYCDLVLGTSGLSGSVLDNLGVKLSGAEIVLEGTNKLTTSNSNGGYSLNELNPVTYKIKVSKQGYFDQDLSITLEKNKTLEYNFTLVKIEGVGEVIGIIKDSNGNPIIGAKIFWTGLITGDTTVNSSGYYKIADLPIGNYTLSASKPGYSTLDKSLKVLEGTIHTLDFTLEEAEFHGIKGTTYIDFNLDEIADSDEITYGAKIYIDGIFKGYSQYPDGKYQIQVEASIDKELHNVSATYQNYIFENEEVEISKSSDLTKDLLLTTFIGECTEPGTEKDVGNFTAAPVPGEKVIKLEWKKPCLEVIGYKIIRMGSSDENNTIFVSPAKVFYYDTKVEWGKEYTYDIIALYDKIRESKPITFGPINVGNSNCEGKYHQDTGWETFCSSEDKNTDKVEKKSVWTCDYNNQLLESLDCSERDGPGESYYCAGVGFREADCKSSGICGLFANPFGLYYNRDVCYGVGGLSSNLETANYCYYEYTHTVVNQCKSCTKVDSCFDYESKDACSVNNCLFGVECKWVDSAENKELIDYGLIIPEKVTPETGHGYCVEEDYSGEEYCSLCGPGAELYENNFCTADVCAGLGNCFSAFTLSSCQACGEYPTQDSNCYAYDSELECVGNQNVFKSPFGNIVLSDDRCEWGRCSWEGIPGGAGSCVKDGDGDLTEDCAVFPSEGERIACWRDISPPKTTILSGNVPIVSLANPNVTFYGDDSYHKHGSQKNKMGKVAYCLTSAQSSSIDECIILGENDPFTTNDYPAKLPMETLTVDLVNSDYFKGKSFDGETLMLKYYSLDKYFNQEDVQEGYVFVDNVPPQFEIDSLEETVGDKTDLTIFLLGTNEPMDCSFVLSQIWPDDSIESATIGREEQNKFIKLENLKGVKFTLNVTCVDDRGNMNSIPEDFVFDLEQNIDIIYPKLNGGVASTEISFEVNTAVGASCQLFKDNGDYVADFNIIDEEGKEHKTNSLPGFVEGTYSNYLVICSDLLAGTEMTDFFNFKVDFSGPQTTIILQEGDRIEEIPAITPLGESTYGWEEYFINSSLVTLSCESDGFDCDHTFYCLGEDCDLMNDPNYQDYSDTFVVDTTTKICYYSTDLGENPSFPTCGKIVVDGFGIILTKPEIYTYNDEQWGVSNQPIFDWEFITKIPTVKCKFDFVSGYDYETIPAHKVKELNAEEKYSFENFPESVFLEYSDDGATKTTYVSCENSEGEISPEEKINLEYDPTEPEIVDPYANPEKLLEGTSVELFVATDDKSVCRFSDNSLGEGTEEFDLMEYHFPGFEDNQLGYTHTQTFEISFLGSTKDYSLNVVCQNGAGDLSKLEKMNFKVDYSSVGNIVSLGPSGYISNVNPTLTVETSKNAFCQYESSNSTYLTMEGSGGKIHTYTLSGLTEKKYIYPVRCTISDHLVNSNFEFTVDLTSPKITEVDDGDYSCGNDEVGIMVYTDEESISGYHYEVYDLGDDGSSTSNIDDSTDEVEDSASNSYSGYYSSFYNTQTNPEDSKTQSSGTLVFNGTAGKDLPLKVSVSNLNSSHKYMVKVRAGDEAGNWGEFEESNGFSITDSNLTECKVDKSLDVEFVINKTCTATLVEMHSNSVQGTNELKYGEHPTSTLCEIDNDYTGQKLSFDKDGWVCYYIEDNSGTNKTGKKKITFNDIDGDGISDDCDLCSGTNVGAVPDEKGCSEGQLTEDEKEEDTDNDGLPDVWEKLFYQEGCQLNYAAIDSDMDGESDSLEDYDGDGYNNYEEYMSGYNPCLADAPERTEEGEDSDSGDSEKKPISSTNVPGETDILSLMGVIFLILGLLMIIGGVGYLVYYYKFSITGKNGNSNQKNISDNYNKKSFAKNNYQNKTNNKVSLPSKISLKNQLMELSKTHHEKTKEKQRLSLFGSFTKNSKEIPHFGKILNKKIPHHDKVKQLANKYVEHKEEIDSGLKHGEKSLFSKLANIAKETKKKDITKVVSKDEAKDIFSKLKNITNKRKEN